MWQQTRLTLPAKPRGFHLITDNIASALDDFQTVETGLLHLFLQHSSASLTINENADPTVRSDMEAHFNKFVPERAPYYQHTYEGDDDMPAHIKSSTLGCQLTIPVRQSTMLLGTWQGIYLGEHRDYASSRNIIVTLQGN